MPPQISPAGPGPLVVGASPGPSGSEWSRRTFIPMRACSQLCGAQRALEFVATVALAPPPPSPSPPSPRTATPRPLRADAVVLVAAGAE
eukprot:scaffold26483_cov91-Phaeocystis_antarctica.AAC.1